MRIRNRLTPTVMWTKAAMIIQATGSKDLGRRCPRMMLSQDTIPAKTMLWEEAQGHNLIFGIIRIPLFPDGFCVYFEN